MFFILAGHGHYSIDVFVAFVLTSRLFLYYHTLANNISLMSRDSKNTKMWFPVFSFFESNSPGLIPNEYEWPLPSWTKVKNYLRGYELVSSKDNSWHIWMNVNNYNVITLPPFKGLMHELKTRFLTDRFKWTFHSTCPAPLGIINEGVSV